MSDTKRVVVEINFDYDHDHADDLLDVVNVRQVYSTLSDDAAHEQTKFLLNDPAWFDAFAHAVVRALTGAPTDFGSSEN